MGYALFGLVRAIVSALFPGLWAIAYQAVIGFVVAYYVIAQRAEGKLPQRQLLGLAAIMGGGGALMFTFAGFFPSIFTALIAACAMWFGFTYLIEAYLDLDLERTQKVTGTICVTTWVSWIIAGAVVTLIRAL